MSSSSDDDKWYWLIGYRCYIGDREKRYINSHNGAFAMLERPRVQAAILAHDELLDALHGRKTGWGTDEVVESLSMCKDSLSFVWVTLYTVQVVVKGEW